MKVLFVRLPDEIHAQMVLLSKREQCSIQKLGVSAITSFLDMAEQHGRFGNADDHSEKQEESSDEENDL